MSRVAKRSSTIALAAAMTVLAASVTVAHAGDDDDLTEEAAPGRRFVRWIERQGIPERIDNWVFADSGGFENSGTDADAPDHRLELLLAKKIKDVARSAPLTDEQKRKLTLAGRFDIWRLIDRVDELKVKYRSVDAAANDGNPIVEETQPLRAAFRRGVFGADSQFDKTLSKMLPPEQVARMKNMARDRRLFQHRAGVHMTVLRLSTALGLSDEQWTRLEQVLLEETRPARFSGTVYPAALFNVVYAQMNRIPEEKLRPIFEPWQWRALREKLSGAANFGAAIPLVDEPNPQELSVPTTLGRRVPAVR